jgi:hypothetical protein
MVSSPSKNMFRSFLKKNTYIYMDVAEMETDNDTKNAGAGRRDARWCRSEENAR